MLRPPAPTGGAPPGARQRCGAARCSRGPGGVATAASPAAAARQPQRAQRLRLRQPRTAAAAAPPPAAGGAAPVVIAGGGIAGLACAAALHKAGVPALVLERAPAAREEGAAIALWPNAWRALDAIGVGDLLRMQSKAPPLTRIELMRDRGKLLRAFDITECDAAAAGGDDAEFRGVRRRALLDALAMAAPPGGVRAGVGIEAVEAQPGPGARTRAYARVPAPAAAGGLQSLLAGAPACSGRG